MLEVRNVSKSFRGLRAVHDASFEVPEGDINGLIGPNGAGKTTIFNMIAGVYAPDSGEILFNQEKIHGLRPDQVCAAGIGRTFQIVKPFAGLTVLDNVMVGAFLRAATAQDARKLAGDIVERLGLGPKRDLPASSLTLPDRKRLEVARALATIIGATGAGKSSLIRSIAGIEIPRAGSITFKGAPITGLESHRTCNLGIGQVAEGRQVFPSLTVLENLEMGAMIPRARAGAKRQLEDVFALFPRLKERSTQIAGTMSGGEQQMLAIGRCLMGAPELIMFDEPSLGLAPLVVREVLHTIHLLNERGLTILLVEQNVAVSLKISQRAYVLENGRIVMSGSGSELLHNDRVRQAYLGL